MRYRSFTLIIIIIIIIGLFSEVIRNNEGSIR